MDGDYALGPDSNGIVCLFMAASEHLSGSAYLDKCLPEIRFSFPCRWFTRNKVFSILRSYINLNK